MRLGFTPKEAKELSDIMDKVHNVNSEANILIFEHEPVTETWLDKYILKWF